MRYADGPTTESEAVVAAPAERIWPLVTDQAWLAGVSDELQRVEWLDGATGAGAGVRFRGHNAHKAIGEWSTVSTVTTWEPQRSIRWTVEADRPDGPAAQWGFDLEPVDGGTRVRQWARLGPGPSGLTAAIERWPDKEERIVAGRLDEWRAGMERNLDAVRAAVEPG
jgi:hypothetical protein